MSDPAEKLTAFTAWAQAHITGDEKGQAQIFLDRLFQAFGHAGSLDVGGEPEFRVRKATDDGGGTSFADYVWKPVVLIEMKKRGTVLSKHYRQAFNYWTRLVPGRPRYVILCNFNEFHVYDFETQMDSPVGRAKLADLAQHYGPLAFLLPGQPSPSSTTSTSPSPAKPPRTSRSASTSSRPAASSARSPSASSSRRSSRSSPRTSACYSSEGLGLRDQ